MHSGNLWLPMSPSGNKRTACLAPPNRGSFNSTHVYGTRMPVEESSTASEADIYRSIRKLMALPEDTRLFMCHDYKAPGRDKYAWETTVREEREKNVHVKEGVSEEEFVAMRNARDATLSAPRLLLPSIQVNIRAGKFPPAHANGVRYLTIPVKFKSGEMST